LHAVPHVPQLVLLVLRSTQLPLQSTVPGAQVHWAPWQTRLPAQIWPQKPQLFLLVCRSTHAFPHLANPVEQFGEHVPPLHTNPGMQRLLHAPQSTGDDVRSTQTGPHCVSPAGQEHEPLRQLTLNGQAFPQVPQLRLSVCRFRHEPMQLVSPVEQPMMHIPPLHCSAPMQRVPQVPQLRGSVCKSVQRPLQLDSPAPQTHMPAVQLAPFEQA
jgi:hypothetical protein